MATCGMVLHIQSQRLRCDKEPGHDNASNDDETRRHHADVTWDDLGRARQENGS